MGGGDQSLAGAYVSCLLSSSYRTREMWRALITTFPYKARGRLPTETGSDQPAPPPFPPCAEPPTGDTSSRRVETATCLVSSGRAVFVRGTPRSLSETIQERSALVFRFRFRHFSPNLRGFYGNRINRNRGREKAKGGAKRRGDREK